MNAGEFNEANHVDPEIYEVMLCSLNHTMEEKFDVDYDLRARCCLSHLHRVIVDTMTRQDLLSTAQRALETDQQPPSPLNESCSRRYSFLQQFDGILGSMEECLSHKIGAQYFKKFLQEQFCVVLI